MQISKWRIHNPPRVDVIHLLIKSSSQQLAKPCNADLAGIPKVEKLTRGRFKSWPNGSQVLRRRLSEESHQLQLVLFSQFQFAQQKAIMGWNILWKQILFLPPNNLHFWQMVNSKVLDFIVELSSNVHTNIKLLNWRWRRSKNILYVLKNIMKPSLIFLLSWIQLFLLRL